MQTRAILEGAAAVIKAGGSAHPEIMIPLVGHVNELKSVRENLEKTAEAVVAEQGIEIDYMFGTMIEIPRAALTADEIAPEAAFFSFGTNDLTQMTFGFSRDDIESKMMPAYLEQGLLKRNPFETIDVEGVGELVHLGAQRGRSTKPDLKLGVCGEHGGDPESIALFYDAGLDYVSCSPFRVPIARLAAAQAVISRSTGKGKAETK
jgi:pyruvate,orthophosphate dikinase